MLARLRPRLTYANVVSTLCLFIVLGGGAYAATKINGKNIKNRTIAGKKLKNDTVRGKQVNEARLGTVPSAARADSATAAERATSADTATNAGNAGTLDGIDSAGFASSASEPLHVVGAPGEPPFQGGWTNGAGSTRTGFYKDPVGVVHIQGDLNSPSTLSEVIFTLPPGYRPAESACFPNVKYLAGFADAAFVCITREGLVAQQGAFDTNSEYFINGITFRAAE